jgi:hypothetical protein
VTLIERIRDGSAPEHVRNAAARGALPFPRAALVQMYLLLHDDAVDEIREAARASIENLSEAEVLEVLADDDCAPEILTHYAPGATRNERMAEKIAFHAAVPPEALAVLASRGSAPVIELVLTNEERLLRSPMILDRLTVNPALRNDQRGRLLELLDRASTLVDSTRESDETDETEVDGIDLEAHARLLEVDIGELYAASEILGGEEFESDERVEIRNAYARILTLNTAQRAILAMKGGREERAILIRDTNRIVALSVLKNGRITDGEVEHIAALRNVSHDVLRTIGSNREWAKTYSVVVALVRNPRTPPGTSTNFVSRLQNHDLKQLIRDKNVAELIRRMAKKTMDTRLQRTNSSFKRR